MSGGYENYNSIVHINTKDVRGGAAKFVWNLNRAQREKGLKSGIIVGFKESNSSEVGVFPIKLDLKVHKSCSKKSLLDFSLYGSHRLLKHPLIVGSDLIHFHNLHGGYFNPFSLSGLSCIKPSVWTLHDMYAITGHCIYFDCDRWEIGCGSCPNLESYFPINCDSTSDLLKYKKMIYDNSILNIVTPTKWFEDKVCKSILRGHRIQTIYHGIDTNTFSPGDKKSLREKYGIPDSKFIIGMAADGGAFGDPRKGGYYINKCLEALDDRGIDYAFVNIGAELQKESNSKIINAGYITDEHKMAELYSTLDVFLFPSLSESFGLVVVEALSCGVPVIAFNYGAMGELIDNGNTGLLAGYKNEEELIEALIELSTNKLLRNRCAHSARISACEKFSFDRMLDQYLRLYDDCIKEFPKYDKKTKLFTLDILPEEIKNNEFYQMEAAKVNNNSDESLVKKQLKVFVLVNTGDINPMDSLTYFSIISQTYENIAVSFGSIEDINAENIDGDLVYCVDEGYILEPDFLEDIVGHYVNEDAMCCMIELYRRDGTVFYNAVLPDIYKKDDFYRINSAKHNNIVFKKEFFVRNLWDIRKMKHLKIDTFDMCNLKLVEAKVSQYTDDIIKHAKNSRIYIYGAGRHTVDLLENIDIDKIKICGIIDKNPDLENSTIRGITIYSASKIDELDIDYIIISSAAYEADIFETLRSKFEEDKLIRIYGEF